jgi:hypothetical protein
MLQPQENDLLYLGFRLRRQTSVQAEKSSQQNASGANDLSARLSSPWSHFLGAGNFEQIRRLANFIGATFEVRKLAGETLA